MDVLVLNSSYQPLRRVSWQRAFGYVCSGRAEIVEIYDGRVVRSARSAWPVPSIVRFLTGAARFFRRTVKFSRRTVYQRDHGLCQYCGGHVSAREFTLDHVIPRSRGGQHRWENVVTACVPCNQRKADRTPREARMALRKQPTRPRSFSRLVPWRSGMPEAWKDYLG